MLSVTHSALSSVKSMQALVVVAFSSLIAVSVMFALIAVSDRFALPHDRINVSTTTTTAERHPGMESLCRAVSKADERIHGAFWVPVCVKTKYNHWLDFIV
jgi:hypothetical protein